MFDTLKLFYPEKDDELPSLPSELSELLLLDECDGSLKSDGLDELLLSALELLLGIIGPGSSSWGWCPARRCAIIPSWGG